MFGIKRLTKRINDLENVVYKENIKLKEIIQKKL